MCNERPAAFILTNLDSGDAEQPCVECFPTFILGIAEAMSAAIGAAPEAEAPATEGDVDPTQGGESGSTPTASDQGESPETPTEGPETAAGADSAPSPGQAQTEQPGPTQPESAAAGTDDAPAETDAEAGSVAPVAAD